MEHDDGWLVRVKAPYISVPRICLVPDGRVVGRREQVDVGHGRRMEEGSHAT